MNMYLVKGGEGGGPECKEKTPAHVVLLCRPIVIMYLRIMVSAYFHVTF